VCAVLFPSSLLARDTTACRQYIRKYKNLAIQEMERSGIPASIILAQGILESDCGRSLLAVEAKNHFGIKCHGWEGDTISMDDDAPGECFRKYKSVSQSYRDHSDFLIGRERYKQLFSIATDDYAGWAKGLQNCGYATDPNYAKRIISIIEKEKLYRFDSKETVPVDIVAGRPLFEDGDESLCKLSLDRPVFFRDGAPYIVASEIDTYGSIAKEYGLFVCELLHYNGLKKVPVKIREGTEIFIGKRKK
jgi:hypothetical protein